MLRRFCDVGLIGQILHGDFIVMRGDDVFYHRFASAAVVIDPAGAGEVGIPRRCFYI